MTDGALLEVPDNRRADRRNGQQKIDRDPMVDETP
jgi:hypothetical protein